MVLVLLAYAQELADLVCSTGLARVEEQAAGQWNITILRLILYHIAGKKDHLGPS